MLEEAQEVWWCRLTRRRSKRNDQVELLSSKQASLAPCTRFGWSRSVRVTLTSGPFRRALRAVSPTK